MLMSCARCFGDVLLLLNTDLYYAMINSSLFFDTAKFIKALLCILVQKKHSCSVYWCGLITMMCERWHEGSDVPFLGNQLMDKARLKFSKLFPSLS